MCADVPRRVSDAPLSGGIVPSDFGSFHVIYDVVPEMPAQACGVAEDSYTYSTSLDNNPSSQIHSRQSPNVHAHEHSPISIPTNTRPPPE